MCEAFLQLYCATPKLLHTSVPAKGNFANNLANPMILSPNY